MAATHGGIDDAKAIVIVFAARLVLHAKRIQRWLKGAIKNEALHEVGSLQQKRRELEARILSLGIEKAKLEQSALLAKIAEMQRTLETVPGASGLDTPAAPAGGKE